MSKTKKMSSFRKGLLIYVGIFVLVALIALSVLYAFLHAYEQSRPDTTVLNYIDNLRKQGLTESGQQALNLLDENLQSREESMNRLSARMQSMTCRKDSKRSSQGELFYNLYSDDQCIGYIGLKTSEKHTFGLTFWDVAEENFDFSAFTGSVQMTLPEDYKLFVNGVELDESYITDSAVQYETLSGFYEHYDNLPMLVHYESGKYIGDAEVVIKDGKGNEVSQDKLNEAYYLDNCDPAKAEKISEFADEFVDRYVFFCANTNQNEYGNYDYLAQIVKPESPLLDRMYNAFWSFGYTTVYSCDIVSRNINLISDLGDCYLVDYSYATDTVSAGGSAREELNIRFTVSENDGTYLAEALSNY